MRAHRVPVCAYVCGIFQYIPCTYINIICVNDSDIMFVPIMTIQLIQVLSGGRGAVAPVQAGRDSALEEFLNKDRLLEVT